MGSLTVVVGLDALYDARPSGSVNVIPGDVVAGGVVYGRRLGGGGVRDAIPRLLGAGVRLVLFSPYGRLVSGRLVGALEAALGLAPGRVEVISPVAASRRGGEARLDAVLVRELAARGVPLSRLVVVDSRRPPGTDLARVRVSFRHATADMVERHLAAVGGYRGDLRGRDLTFHREDYDDEGRAALLSWAGERLEAMPAASRSGLAGESVLCLDFDQTLVHTDCVPLSREGRERYSRVMALFGLAPPADEEAPAEVAEEGHDYRVGDYGGWVRPGLVEFLAAARGLFDRVCIYTAATEEYVRLVLSQTVPEDLRPDFVIDRSRGIHRGGGSRSGKSVVLLEALGYHPSRVVLVDDNPGVYSFSRRNLVSVDGFYGPRAGRRDAALHRLLGILTSLARSEDFRLSRAPRHVLWDGSARKEVSGGTW